MVTFIVLSAFNFVEISDSAEPIFDFDRLNDLRFLSLSKDRFINHDFTTPVFRFDSFSTRSAKSVNTFI